MFEPSVRKQYSELVQMVCEEELKSFIKTALARNNKIRLSLCLKWMYKKRGVSQILTLKICEKNDIPLNVQSVKYRSN